MRGKRCVGRVQHPWPRIIPAHAGQTRRDISTSGRSPDHPRACGANGKISSKTMVRTGSSPRMRGKLRVERGRDDKIRIIPAHAGQTHGRRYMADRTPDHPRACGANSTKYNARHMPTGSSPRMRGKPLRFLVFDPCGRIIPAHAGQTTAATPRSRAFPDHPRACGANESSVYARSARIGSSPRMRGKRSPSCLAASRPDSPDHPRACGANSFTPAFNWPSTGSSPRMRGKLREPLRVLHDIRIIPAHAGQTFVIGARGLGKTDHPRACGANAAAGRIRTLRRGSSPRMRGKQGGRRKLEREIRIIPAHAGQTAPARDATSRSSDHPRACGANSCSCSA